MKPPPAPRPLRVQKQLENAALAAGVAWAAWWASDLEQRKRRAAGGWPGTLSEARARVLAQVASEVGADVVLAPAELDALTRTAYQRAKSEWRARSLPDSDP